MSETIARTRTRVSRLDDEHWFSHALLTKYLVVAIGARALVVPAGSFSFGDRFERPHIAIFDLAAAAQQTSRRNHANLFATIDMRDAFGAITQERARLYAKFGIADYLVVDRTHDVVVKHSEPREFGYAVARELRRRDTFELERLPGLTLAATPFLDVA